MKDQVEQPRKKPKNESDTYANCVGLAISKLKSQNRWDKSLGTRVHIYHVFSLRYDFVCLGGAPLIFKISGIITF